MSNLVTGIWGENSQFLFLNKSHYSEMKGSNKHLVKSLIFSLAAPTARRSSLAKDPTNTTAATQAIAETAWSTLKCLLFFLGLHLQHMEVPRLGVKSELQLPQQHQIRAASVTYTTAHSNAGSLTHWMRPGIKPASSQILVGFLSYWATIGTPIKWLLFKSKRLS